MLVTNIERSKENRGRERPELIKEALMFIVTRFLITHAFYNPQIPTMSYPPAEELHGCEIKGKTKPIPKSELNDNCMAFFLQTYIVTHSLANAADRLQCHPSHSTQKL